MSTHSMAHEGEHHIPATKTFLMVWIGLVVITLIEVLLAYVHLNPHLMLVLLMGLSICKAAMIISWFMHLKYEKFTLVLFIIPAMVVCICLFGIFFPDSMRALEMRY
ncbi:MAG: cytochrome C oxidase subunit IV family protein [Acidobacteria bacterium]|nr:cytochrome C oxidase subunit IV family protein [Acidobacteriota bacterium]